MRKSRFEDKFLSKLSKIDRQDIEGFLSHLVREKNFLQVLFNALLDGVIVLRPNLEVLYTNNAALEMLGLGSRRRIVGERITDLCPGRELRALVARFAIDRKPVTNAEIELAGGDPQWVTVSIIPLETDLDQAAGCVLMVLHDASELRKAEEQRRRAERAMTMASLSAGLAHEIKNPLNSLQIHAQLLQRALRERAKRARRPDTGRDVRSGDIVVEEIARLGKVVNDFLSAVRPTRPLFQKANINNHVGRVAETIRPEAESRGVSLALNLDHDIPPVDFDPNQITQALLNLLKNSLEALEGSPAPAIELRTALEDSGYLIRVIDNGLGIPESEMKKILEPYFTTKFSGTGLGLAIVSRIVEEHRGTLEVLSGPGKGTCATMRFPLESRPVRLLEGTPPQKSATA
jgi:PAS domain S-box-containing protein